MRMEINRLVNNLISQQLQNWELAKINYIALQKVQTRRLMIGEFPVLLQFNPERIRSSAAKVDTRSLKERPCFLCPVNRPVEQRGILFAEEYEIIVNPYPIFQKHLTIPILHHEEQRIFSRFGDMLLLAEALTDFVVFYNGPKCGASAPDHAHFQAGNKGFLPIEESWHLSKKEQVAAIGHTTLYVLRDFQQSPFVLLSEDREEAVRLFHHLYTLLYIKPGEEEPMMNILAWYQNGQWITCIFPRKELRPSCYYAEGDTNLLISPATVEMGGVFAIPLQKDYDKITAGDIQTILNEVCLSSAEMDELIQKI